MMLAFARDVFVAWLAAITLLLPGPVLAADADTVPERLDYLIGAKPGGGYDRYGRLVARYMEKHLPATTVVPINMATAGGVTGLREIVDNGASGGKIIVFNTGQLLSELGGRDLGLSKMRWIGKASSEARVLVMSSESGIEDFGDLRDRGEGLVFVTSAYGNSAHVQTHLINDAFGLKLRIVPGFGGNEAEAAIAKGEADGTLTSESNVAALLASGRARPILVFGTAHIPELAGVPTGRSVAATDDEALVAEAISALSELGRPTVGSADLDPAVLETLRAAYHAALTDPALLAEAEAQGMLIDYLPGAETENLARGLFGSGERLSAMIKAALAR